MVEPLGGDGVVVSAIWRCRTFLQREEIGSPATISKLKGIISEPSKEVYLKVELASVVDYGKPFVTAIYHTLEGDLPLVLTCFEVIEEVQASIRSGFTPNVDAVANTLSSVIPHRLAQLKAYSQRCIQPGLDYFDKQLRTINNVLIDMSL